MNADHIITAVTMMIPPAVLGALIGFGAAIILVPDPARAGTTVEMVVVEADRETITKECGEENAACAYISEDPCRIIVPPVEFTNLRSLELLAHETKHCLDEAKGLPAVHVRPPPTSDGWGDDVEFEQEKADVVPPARSEL